MTNELLKIINRGNINEYKDIMDSDHMSIYSDGIQYKLFRSINLLLPYNIDIKWYRKVIQLLEKLIIDAERKQASAFSQYLEECLGYQVTCVSHPKKIYRITNRDIDMLICNGFILPASISPLWQIDKFHIELMKTIMTYITGDMKVTERFIRNNCSMQNVDIGHSIMMSNNVYGSTQHIKKIVNNYKKDKNYMSVVCDVLSVSKKQLLCVDYKRLQNIKYISDNLLQYNIIGKNKKGEVIFIYRTCDKADDTFICRYYNEHSIVTAIEKNENKFFKKYVENVLQY